MRFLCVPNKVRDLRQFYLTYAFCRACRIESKTCGQSRATLTHLSCSPNFPCASYLDERTLTYEPIVNWHVRFLCAPKIVRNLKRSYLTCAVLCVPTRVWDLKSALLNMCVLCAWRIECETWGNLAWHMHSCVTNRVWDLRQSCLTHAFRACRIECVTWSQSYLTCVFPAE